MKGLVKVWVLVCMVWVVMPSLAQDGSFKLHSYECKDGKGRPYVVYEPVSSKKIKKPALMVYLHGAVSRKELNKDPLAYAKKSALLKVADEAGCLMLFCFGQKGATWFDEIGGEMVLSETKQVVKKYKANTSRIFLSGFSDGASGSFYLAHTQPEKFAGFIVLNGHLKIASKIGEAPIYLQNSNNKPMYIVNTNDDMLYPAEGVVPIIDHLKKYNSKVTFKQLEGNHEMSYFEDETEVKALANFIHNNEQNTHEKLSFETSNLNYNELHWLKITELDTTLRKADWHHNKNLKVLNNKADFGMKYDYSYTGDGLKVASFKNDSCTAKKMGVEVGDIIQLLEKDSVTSPYSPFYYVAKKKAGDETAITLSRNGETMELKGHFNEGIYYDLLDFSRKSARIEASLEGKKLLVQTSCIKAFSINLDQLPERGKKDLKLIVNDRLYQEISPKTKGVLDIEIRNL